MIKLMKHQEDVLKQTENKNKVAYYLDMGLGKTYIGSEKLMKLDSRINLVVCQKSKVDDWLEHFVNHYELENNVMIYDCTKWKKDDWEKLSEDPCFNSDWHNKEHYILVINYDLIFRRPQLFKLNNFTLMLDESSIIQHKTADRTKAIMKMKPTNVILLSGTPASGKYENLWTQCKLLGYDISEELFLKQYVNFKKIDTDVGIKKIVDKDDPYKNFERLKSKLSLYGAVFMKTEEVLDLPEQTFIIENIKAPKEYYKFMKNNIVEINDKTLIGDMKLTKRLYSRQLCGLYNKLKYDYISDIIDSTNDRLIIFYNFNEELQRLKELIKDRPISEVNGTIKDLANYEKYDNSVSLIQYQAGAMGLNLQKANKIIYFSLTESSDLFEQSKKRIHRIGTTQPCFYYLPICQKTIEESIYNALLLKQDYNDKLFEKEYLQ